MTPKIINDQYSSLPNTYARYRARKIEAGLCVHTSCKNPPKEGRRECLEHARQSSDKALKWYHSKKGEKNV